MQPEVEILSGLERRVDLVVSIADVEKEVQTQLKRVARTAKVQGFRPGKAPLSLIERSHGPGIRRSEEHTSELQSLMRISYAVFCLKKKTTQHTHNKSKHP